MKIVMGADDEGEVFDAAIARIRARGHDVVVMDKQQWPDIALAVAQEVAAGRADQGVLMCWTGTGTAMMANKVPGARAALVWDPWIADGARRWNDANILVMSLKKTDLAQVDPILEAWFAVASPDPDELDNIAKLAKYEGGPYA